MTRERFVVDNGEAEQKIKNLAPFRNRSGALRGVENGADEFGLLPERWWNPASDAVYVVYSYRTPIAWVTADGARVIPDIGYSPITGEHQLAVKTAWHGTEWTGGGLTPARGREVVPVPATHELRGKDRRLRRGGIDGRAPEWYGSEDSFTYSV